MVLIVLWFASFVRLRYSWTFGLLGLFLALFVAVILLRPDMSFVLVLRVAAASRLVLAQTLSLDFFLVSVSV